MKRCRNCAGIGDAWLRFRDATPSINLCKPCLDAWFDAADDRLAMEPRIWGWLPRRQVAARAWVYREPRFDPTWLWEMLQIEVGQACLLRAAAR